MIQYHIVLIGNDPFNNLAGSFNQIAANTFSSAASQQATAFQQAQRPGNSRVVSTSVSTSGNGSQFASTQSIGTGWQQVSASASSQSHSNNQRRRNNQSPTARSTRPSRRPANGSKGARTAGQSV